LDDEGKENRIVIQVYRTTDGTAFDGPGIPPDMPVSVFADDDVAAGRGPAMAKAIEVLRSGSRPGLAGLFRIE
jgi:C-terminal processing protease CtpA/Prc